MNLNDAPLLFARPQNRPSLASSPGGTLHDATLLLRMLDEIDYGLLLVGGDGRLRYANQLALQALRGAAPLQLSGGRLCPADPGERDALCAALADALHGRRTLLTLGGGDQALSVAVVPIDDGQQALALLVLNKPQSCTALSLDFYARANGLTNAETTVLACLSQGVKPKDIAQQLGVAISTVRSQIASIRAKTQTASIPELAGRVAALPPFTSALKWEQGDWDDAALRGHQRPLRGAPQRVPLQPRFADAC